MKWKAKVSWWGQSQVVRECTEEEWDGNLRINGVPHLYWSKEYMEPSKAEKLAEQLNSLGVKVICTEQQLIDHVKSLPDRTTNFETTVNYMRLNWIRANSPFDESL